MDEEGKVVPVRQLKVKGMEAKEGVAKKEEKEKEKPGNKWVMVIILVLTVLASLIFKMTNRNVQETKITRPGATTSTTKPVPAKKGFNLFGTSVYQFSK